MQDFIPIKKDINEHPDNVFIKQYDHKSRFIHLQIMDKDLGDDVPMVLNGCVARLFVQTDDVEGTLVNGEISDGEDGIASFLLPNSVSQTPGKYACEIRITDPSTDALISTRAFNLEVEESIFNDAAYEQGEELSALQQALNEADNFDNRITNNEKAIGEILDENAYVKPVAIGEKDGNAAQGIVYIDSDKYLITSVYLQDETKTIISLFDESQGKIIAEEQVSFGHANSIAKDTSGVFYVPHASGASVIRFQFVVDDNRLYIEELDPLAMPPAYDVKNVFNIGNDVYAFGIRNGQTCYWSLSGNEKVNISLPENAPRTNQSIASDGTFLYWLRSNPNTIAVFDLHSGNFIRWINIGDYVGGTTLIGEAESICVKDSKLKLLSQFYYPDAINNMTRFWMVSELYLSKNLPANQQHVYPNNVRYIYVSNESPNGVLMPTNNGDDTSDQIGSENQPYPSLELALYAAMATPNLPIEIIMKNTGTDYYISDLVLRIPSMAIVINCLGNVTFNFLHMVSGNVTITGESRFERISTTSRSRLQISKATFTAEERVTQGNTTIAPYSLNGVFSLINCKYTGGSNDIMFDFVAGSNGTVEFNVDDEGTTAPRGTNPQSANLVLTNVRTTGHYERWVVIYSGATTIQINTAVTMDFTAYFQNGGVYRIKWRADANADYYNTVFHVNGDTAVDLATMVGNVYRVAKLQVQPRTKSDDTYINGRIKVINVTDYYVSNNAITSSPLTTGNLPSGFEIAEIAVRGY